MKSGLRAYVYGSRDYAQTVARLAAECGVEILGFVDDFAPLQARVFRFEDLRQQAGSDCGMLIGVGYNDLPGRWALWQRIKQAGWRTPSLVHPRAHVALTAQLGEGCIVMAAAVVDHGAQLGQACALWPQANVSHDAHVGDNCFLSPQALLCGHARLGSHSFMGAGSLVVDRADLPEGTRLKMGQAHTRRT